MNCVIRLHRAVSRIHGAQQNFKFSVGQIQFLDQNWRKSKRLSENPNAEGPLTNMKDYSFLNGKETPLGQRQKRRLLQQRDIAKQIVTLSKEIDYAIERHQNLKKQEEETRQNILSNKLKAKGHNLFEQIKK